MVTLGPFGNSQMMGPSKIRVPAAATLVKLDAANKFYINPCTFGFA
jgi:hypothetical protein